MMDLFLYMYTKFKLLFVNHNLVLGLKMRGLYEPEEKSIQTTEVNDVIDKNLDQMLTSIHRLKGTWLNLLFDILKNIILFFL